MKEKTVAVPLIGLIAATRAMLGAGAALLFLSDLQRKKRRRLGWALFLTGAVSTLPLAHRVFHHGSPARKQHESYTESETNL